MSKAPKKNKEEKTTHGTISNNLFMLRFVARNAPGMLFLYIFFDLLTNVPWILSSVVLLKYIIDVVTSGVDYYRIAVACGIFAALVIVGTIGSTVFYEIYRPKQKERLHFKLYSSIYEKAAKMDFEAYDNPEYYNDLVLAMTSMNERVDSVISDAQDIIRLLTSILSITAVIASIDPICLVFIFLCVAVMIPIGRLIAKVNVDRTEAMTPLDRKNLYFSRVFYLQDYAKELRLNPAGRMIEDRYNKNVKDRLLTISPFLRKQWQLYFCQEALPMTLLVYLGIALLMGYKAIVTKEISLGDFAATFNGANAVSRCVFDLTSWFSINLREN